MPSACTAANALSAIDRASLPGRREEPLDPLPSAAEATSREPVALEQWRYSQTDRRVMLACFLERPPRPPHVLTKASTTGSGRIQRHRVWDSRWRPCA